MFPESTIQTLLCCNYTNCKCRLGNQIKNNMVVQVDYEDDIILIKASKRYKKNVFRRQQTITLRSLFSDPHSLLSWCQHQTLHKAKLNVQEGFSLHVYLQRSNENKLFKLKVNIYLTQPVLTCYLLSKKLLSQKLSWVLSLFAKIHILHLKRDW